LKKFKFWINLGLGIAVAAFFLWLFFRSVEDWGEMWQALRTVRYVYLITAVALVWYGWTTRKVWPAGSSGIVERS